MAKSLRSKWKRKMKAEKRVRYAEKEKTRLLNMLDQHKKDQKDWDDGTITRKSNQSGPLDPRLRVSHYAL